MQISFKENQQKYSKQSYLTDSIIFFLISDICLGQNWSFFGLLCHCERSHPRSRCSSRYDFPLWLGLRVFLRLSIIYVLYFWPLTTFLTMLNSVWKQKLCHVLSINNNNKIMSSLLKVAMERGVNSLGCDTVVEYRGKLTCTFPEIEESPEKIETDGSHVFSVDHVHPHSAREMELVVLYADVENDDFGKFHSKIMDLVKRGRVTYVFRHFLPKRSQQKVRMSG